jgi:dolichyl-phosphate beta-glucosyltransferase
MDLSLVLPVYNEEKVIGETLLSVSSFLKSHNFDYEIILVNDGSQDNSFEVVKKLDLPGLVILDNSKNLGKGAAVRKGMLAAQGRFLLFMDADNSTTIDNLPVFWKELEENRADIAIASRALKSSRVNVHQRKIKENLGKLGNLLVRWLLVKGIKDTQCGFKLFRNDCQKLFRRQKLNRWGFDFEILFLARKSGFRIVELPVVWTNNPDSKVRPIDYFGTLKELLTIIYNNLTGKYFYEN